MAIRVGIDLTSVAEVEEALGAHAERYLERVFTPAEREECGRDATRLAERFAAKEATLKVLRPAAGDAVPLLDVDTSGGEIGLTGSVARLAETQDVGGLMLSVTHRPGLVAALVVAGAGPSR